MATLTFLGAAQTVTGSKYLLEHGDAKVLVDCGLFQGLKALRQRNWEELPVAARDIDAVVLTHAHLDHTGYLPRLVSQGFRGRVFCTAGTKDLCGLILPDSARIQEEDARQANKHGYSRHAPALPLYGEGDAFRALTQLQPVGYERPMPVAKGITAEFLPAGHLLGSSFVVVRLDSGKTIVFGGDLGRYSRPVLPDPSPAGVDADLLLLESTYGDRDHAPDDDGEALATIVRETEARGGKLIIPAFAIGRTEELIYWLRRLEQAKRIPVLPVYLDSPMAIGALKHYQTRSRELDPDMRADDQDVCTFCTERFQTVATAEQSKAVTASRAPAIIISASGMATGGRVLHHLIDALPDERNTVLFAGYQAAGTRGRRLVDGDLSVKIHGGMVPVRARVAQLDSVSAHADRGEILRWLGTFLSPPKRVALVHGEPRAIVALETLIKERLGLDTHPAQDGERLEV